MTSLEKCKLAKSSRGRSNYHSGMNFEFKVMREERKNSVVILRSAGSHSMVDIMSIRKNKSVWLISCKANGYFTPLEDSELRKLKTRLPQNHKIKKAYYVNLKKYVIEDLK